MPVLPRLFKSPVAIATPTTGTTATIEKRLLDSQSYYRQPDEASAYASAEGAAIMPPDTVQTATHHFDSFPFLEASRYQPA